MMYAFFNKETEQFMQVFAELGCISNTMGSEIEWELVTSDGGVYSSFDRTVLERILELRDGTYDTVNNSVQYGSYDTPFYINRLVGFEIVTLGVQE